MRFVGLLFLFSLGGFAYSVAMLHHYGVPVGELLVRAFDLITLVGRGGCIVRTKTVCRRDV